MGCRKLMCLKPLPIFSFNVKNIYAGELFLISMQKVLIRNSTSKQCLVINPYTNFYFLFLILATNNYNLFLYCIFITVYFPNTNQEIKSFRREISTFLLIYNILHFRIFSHGCGNKYYLQKLFYYCFSYCLIF